MIEKWEIAYQQMIYHIDRSNGKTISEQERAGHAYKIALKCWQQLKEEMKSYEFKDEEDGIHFYKSVKPKFTGYIEYLMLLNHGLLFIPTESIEAEQIYWQYEVERLSRFKERNRSFVDYYKSGSTQHDEKYFLPAEEDSVQKVSKVYDLDGEFITPHDHLVASLLAEEKYHEFAKKKLNETLKK